MARPSAPAGFSRLRKALSALAFAIVLIILLTIVFVPVRQYLAAASLLRRLQDPASASWFANWVANRGANPVATGNLTIPASTPITARLYRPLGQNNAPAIVVLHGVHRLGIEEPRMVAFARALSSHGFLVLTPELQDLAAYRVTPASIQTIGESAHFLRQRTGRPVSIIGLSFAGGLALMAAARPEWRDDIFMVTAVGAHDDLRRVLQYYATNLIEKPTGEAVRLPAHEYGPLIVVYNHPEEFFSPRDLPIARAALRSLLWEDVAGAHREAARLSPEGQARMELLFEHHADALAPLLLRSIGKYRAEMDLVSPHGSLAGLRAKVYLLHGAGDNIIPPSETEWLARDLPAGCLRRALISPAISHLDMKSKPSLVDELKLVHFMAELLREARASSSQASAWRAAPWRMYPAEMSASANALAVSC